MSNKFDPKGGTPDGKLHVVTAGTLGGDTGAGGRNGLPMATSGLLPGMVTKKAITLVDTTMKLGKGGGAKKGLRAGFLGGANDASIGSTPGYTQVSAGGSK